MLQTFRLNHREPFSGTGAYFPQQAQHLIAQQGCWPFSGGKKIRLHHRQLGEEREGNEREVSWTMYEV